jgi:hypothetical protein
MASRISDWLRGLGRSWFAIAMLVLVLLSIPGFLLYALNLFGFQDDFNKSLHDTFKLTYHIPIGWSIALILLLVPLAIILLYFLKLRRKPLSVPSTFLWRKSIEDLHVNALFQWLRQNLLLLLQLLAVLFLIYGVMDFRVHGRTTGGKHYILIIDNSASMAATDLAPSRLHWAKQEAIKEIDAATDNDYGMVIEVNSSAEIRQSYTNNRGQLRSAVAAIEQTQRPTRIDEAFSLAESLANPTRSTDDASVRPANVEPGKERVYVAADGIAAEVHLFSDGRFNDLPDFTVGNLSINYHMAGKPTPPGQGKGAATELQENTDNVAIVSFSAARDEQDPSKLQAFVRILNYRNLDVDAPGAKVALEVYAGGRLTAIKEKPLSLKARQVAKFEDAAKGESEIRDTPGEQAVTFDLADIDDRANTYLHAKLTGVNDKLAIDDEAWLVVGVVRKARILIVGPPNSILSAFFDDTATREVATVTYLEPPDLAKPAYRKPGLNGDYDLVVFDRCAPAKVEEMPRANTFFIGYPPPPWNKAELGTVTNPQIRGWMGKHPIMRYIAALQDVGIAEAFKMKDLPPRTPKLIETDQNVGLLMMLSRQTFTDLVLTFPILTDKGQWNTYWPLLPSFPLFLRNVIYALGNISDGAGEETLQPGQVKVLRPDVAVEQIAVTDPDGNTRKLERGTRTEFPYSETDHAGVYRVSWNGKWERSFAVNLLDADESNIEPRPSVRIGAESIAAGQEHAQPHELWKWFVLLALGVLLAEWYIYNRRVYI